MYNDPIKVPRIFRCNLMPTELELVIQLQGTEINYSIRHKITPLQNFEGTPFQADCRSVGLGYNYSKLHAPTASRFGSIIKAVGGII